jgi:(R)-amidase
MDYAGRSLVARPDGGVRAALDTAERDLVVDLDPDVLARQRDLVGVYD